MEVSAKGFIAMVIVVLLVAGLLLSVANVPTGHTGIVVTFGRVENRTLESGIHFKLPWQRVVKMDNRVQKETIQLACFSSDIQEVSMVYTINYQIDSSNAMQIYRNIGKNYYNTIILPNSMESIKVIAAQYTAEELVGERSKMAQDIEENLAAKLKDYNIYLVSTSVEDMDFTDAFTNAVEDKQVAAQNKLRAETEAEQKIIEANAAAEVRKVEAEAEAFEIMTKAEAEAAANEKIASSITNTLIDYVQANNWNGEYPTYYGGNGSLILNGLE